MANAYRLERACCYFNVFTPQRQMHGHRSANSSPTTLSTNGALSGSVHLAASSQQTDPEHRLVTTTANSTSLLPSVSAGERRQKPITGTSRRRFEPKCPANGGIPDIVDVLNAVLDLCQLPSSSGLGWQGHKSRQHPAGSNNGSVPRQRCANGASGRSRGESRHLGLLSRYDTKRPHSALGYRPPAAEVVQ